MVTVIIVLQALLRMLDNSAIEADDVRIDTFCNSFFLKFFAFSIVTNYWCSGSFRIYQTKYVTDDVNAV